MENSIWRPTLIISGGQTGVDIGCLRGAKQLGFLTSGWMPKGFRTEAGNKPSYAKIYNMYEHQSDQYPPRTETNVVWGDATLIVSLIGAPERGSTLTKELCRKHVKPFYWLDIPHTRIVMATDVERIRVWLNSIEPNVLNCAGNRESVSPGIEDWSRRFMHALFD